MARKSKQTAISAEVAKRLEMARNDGSTWLDLGDCGLTEIPEAVYGLTEIERINLSHNQLTQLPERLWGLPKLKQILLVSNPLKSLPNRKGLIIDPPIYLDCRRQIDPGNIRLWIVETITAEHLDLLLRDQHLLRGLSDLGLGQWQLSPRGYHDEPTPEMRRLIDSLGAFSALKNLSIKCIQLETVPESIRSLVHLEALELSAIAVNALPDWIAELSQLKYLYAYDNKLTGLPLKFSQLKQLKSIELSSSPLSQIPDCIFGLASLEVLDITGCQIREIPADILRLPKLRVLHCAGNPIETPPEAVAVKGLEAIRDYWRQRTEVGVDYLCEAKLIILGEPGAGKTSLARKIENPQYQLIESEKSTEGIEVIHYQFQTLLRIKEKGIDKEIQKDFQVNIWDFGGQEIYHATHQFFLTRRSVYILLCDDRKEDTDFAYWLHIVDLLSGGSPLLIMQNEKQDRSRDINLSHLRGQFGHLREAIATNLANNRGLEQVMQAIRKELERLPHVGEALPATWKRVRQALEQDARDFISLEQYLNLCDEHGFTRREDKLQLSGYLHDLGICLHFQDDPLLKNTVVLKPAWGTDAVYRVLDDRQVNEAQGRFCRADLQRIWSKPCYAGMQDELLALMMKFQLCYRLENQQTFIAPQLLSAIQPSYGWNPLGGLVVRYEYEFMPKGIITRFIVALHHLIADDTLVWKTGVILQRDGCRAEVIEAYFKQHIRVRLDGLNPLGLLSIIDDQLQKLHASFPGLKYDRHLPCPCPECRHKAEPYGFPLANLIKMANKAQPIQCHESGEMVDALRLVREILPGALQAQHSREFDYRAIASAPAPAPTPELFVSYAWNPESKTLVDKLQEALAAEGIHLLRDKEEVRYKDSIREFMRRIGQGKGIVVVISEKYLKSENCMFEMLEILNSNGFRERIFPIVLEDSNIYDTVEWAGYVEFWEDKIKKLDKSLKKIRGDNTSKLHEALTLYAEIRRSFDSITDTLRDMNALTPDQHEGTDFEALIARIKAQLGT